MAVFEKGIRLRHIGHLDIQRAMMRALRRSGLPVAYSNGYNPHILLTFASALSTGAAGKKEILDVTMAREVSPDDFLQQMNRALPPDLQLSFARALDDKHPAMMALVQAADYTLQIEDANAANKMIAAIPDFLQQTSILAMRHEIRHEGNGHPPALGVALRRRHGDSCCHGADGDAGVQAGYAVKCA